MSMAFYPTGTVPFQHSMKQDMDSFTRQLEGLNYGGLDAMHPFKGSGYNRIDACEKLGFDKFYTMGDESPYEDIIKKYRYFQYNQVYDYDNKIEGFF